MHTKANVFVEGRIILSKLPNLLNILANSFSEEPYGKFFTNRTWLLLFTPSTFPAAYSSKDDTFTPAFVRAFLVSAITCVSAKAMRTARSSASRSSNSLLLTPYFLAMFSTTYYVQENRQHEAQFLDRKHIMHTEILQQNTVNSLGCYCYEYQAVMG